jgi:hypothetical protein
MTARLRSFLKFWYDFIVGDDWRVAAAVVVGLALTYALSRSSIAAWWVLPVAIGVFLPVSLWRATRPRPGGSRTSR